MKNLPEAGALGSGPAARARTGVLWITGLSGAGKSTVAGLLRDRLVAEGHRPVLLDGDRLRAILPETPGYTEAERRRLAMYYARLAGQLASQGHLVICSTVSLFHEVQEWSRRNVMGYVEVWLRVPVDALAEREGRAAFYGHGGRPGALRDVVGVDTRAEFPEAPDLIVDNHGDMTAERAADLILGALGPCPGTD